jgi:hypothetical protein
MAIERYPDAITNCSTSSPYRDSTVFKSFCSFSISRSIRAICSAVIPAICYQNIMCGTFWFWVGEEDVTIRLRKRLHSLFQFPIRSIKGCVDWHGGASAGSARVLRRLGPADIITVGVSLSASAVAAESRTGPGRLLRLAFNDASGVHDRFGISGGRFGNGRSFAPSAIGP